jgi:hypothetical protein
MNAALDAAAAKLLGGAQVEYGLKIHPALCVTTKIAGSLSAVSAVMPRRRRQCRR